MINLPIAGIWLAPTFWLWLWASMLSGNPNHAIYLSLSDMTFEKNLVTVQVKVFSDDLQDALKNYDGAGYSPADLDHFFALNEPLAARYFGEHLQVSINNKNVLFDYQGFSIEKDAHFIRFEAKLSAPAQKVAVKADFLMELFPDQSNVVKVVQGQQVRYLRFSQPAAWQPLIFER